MEEEGTRMKCKKCGTKFEYTGNGKDFIIYCPKCEQYYKLMFRVRAEP